MENKNIIIILVAIIIVLAAVLGIMFLQPTNSKEPTQVRITSNKTLYEGDSLSIKLMDLNKTAIPKEIVNITITNNKGKVVVDDVVKTNAKGIAKLNLELKKGRYVVNASYGGNQNYTGNDTTQNLTIKEEEVVEVDSSESSTTSGGGNSLEGPEVDSHGVTKQQVMQSGYDNVKYDAENGIYVKYDPKTGVYHD